MEINKEKNPLLISGLFYEHIYICVNIGIKLIGVTIDKDLAFNG